MDLIIDTNTILSFMCKFRRILYQLFFNNLKHVEALSRIKACSMKMSATASQWVLYEKKTVKYQEFEFAKN